MKILTIFLTIALALAMCTHDDNVGIYTYSSLAYWQGNQVLFKTYAKDRYDVIVDFYNNTVTYTIIDPVTVNEVIMNEQYRDNAVYVYEFTDSTFTATEGPNKYVYSN